MILMRMLVSMLSLRQLPAERLIRRRLTLGSTSMDREIARVVATAGTHSMMIQKVVQFLQGTVSLSLKMTLLLANLGYITLMAQWADCLTTSDYEWGRLSKFNLLSSLKVN